MGFNRALPTGLNLMRTIPANSILVRITCACILLVLAACDNKSAQPDTAAMNAASGAYKSCAACHGAEGEGNVNLNAPALVNLDDWYMKRQLINFRDGIRGRHSEDIDGMVMATHSLTTDAASKGEQVPYKKPTRQGHWLEGSL